jgi:phosphatidate cytidylyltransferase
MPNKTVEGYIGGIVLTAIWAYYAAGYLAQFQYLICSQTSLSLEVFGGLTCEESPVFRVQRRRIDWLPQILTLGNIEFDFRPVQLHSVIISIFASLVAPFG